MLPIPMLTETLRLPVHKINLIHQLLCLCVLLVLVITCHSMAYHLPLVQRRWAWFCNHLIFHQNVPHILWVTPVTCFGHEDWGDILGINNRLEVHLSYLGQRIWTNCWVACVLVCLHIWPGQTIDFSHWQNDFINCWFLIENPGQSQALSRF